MQWYNYMLQDKKQDNSDDLQLPTIDGEDGTTGNLRKRSTNTIDKEELRKIERNEKNEKNEKEKKKKKFEGFSLDKIKKSSIYVYKNFIEKKIPEKWSKVDEEDGRGLPCIATKIIDFFKFSFKYFLLVILLIFIVHFFTNNLFIKIIPLFQLYQKSSDFMITDNNKIYNIFNPTDKKELLNRYLETNIEDENFLFWLNELKSPFDEFILMPLNDLDFENDYYESHIYLDNKVYNITFNTTEILLIDLFNEKEIKESGDLLCYHSIEIGLTRNILVIKKDKKFFILYDPIIADYNDNKKIELLIDIYYKFNNNNQLVLNNAENKREKFKLPHMITLQYKNKLNSVERIKVKDELYFCTMFYLLNFNSLRNVFDVVNNE